MSVKKYEEVMKKLSEEQKEIMRIMEELIVLQERTNQLHNEIIKKSVNINNLIFYVMQGVNND